MPTDLPRSILFVCTMNRNRSVMAEVIFKRLLQQLKNPSTSGIRCTSAGTRAPDGAPADSSTFQVMKRRGFDLSGFESSRLTSELVRGADLVLTMERAQKNQIVHTMPESASKVFTLKEYVGEKENLDVVDSIGRGIEGFNAAADEIQALLTRLIEKLGL